MWDVRCSDSLATDNIETTAGYGFASNNAVKRKHQHHSNIKQNFHFAAFSVETLIPWAEEDRMIINKLGRLLA